MAKQRRKWFAGCGTNLIRLKHLSFSLMRNLGLIINIYHLGVYM